MANVLVETTLENFAEEQSLQSQLDYSPEVMEKCYTVAYNYLEQGRHRDAGDIFAFLAFLNPAVPAYWLGLGIAEQGDEAYEQAMAAYSFALLTQPDDPTPYYHTARCQFALGDKDEALKTLNKAAIVAGDSDRYDELKKWIVFEQQLLTQMNTKS